METFKVIKRDGTLQDFDDMKIIMAIKGAYDDMGKKFDLEAEHKAEEIAATVAKVGKDISVEEIQDIVENKLMASNAKDVARAYIRYRYKRELARSDYQQFMNAITEKITARNVQNQNANMDEHSFGGRIGEATNLMMKEYALNYCMSKLSRNNHLNNEIYIHDLDHYAVGCHNCLSVPIDKLLANGFNTRQTDIRPAQSINTAMQLVAVLFQLQSLQQFGGVSATHLDWSMVPYVRKSFYKHYKTALNCDRKIAKYNDAMAIDDIKYKKHKKAYKYALKATEKETYQAVEGMYHNLNTLQSRSGNQLPFSSINYGTCTSPEGRMVIKALLDVSIKGIGKLHKTPIFPCGIFQMMKGVNREPGDPNYDLYQLALRSTSQRLYPNYANVDWSGNAGYDRNDPCTYFSTMGCRTANGWDINGFKQRKDGRGNICPVTIILPTIAMEAKEEYDYRVEKGVLNKGTTFYDIFFALLDQKICEAKDMLLERFEYICNQPAESARFMYENGTMEGYNEEEGIRGALKHGTIVIGQLGLAEALQILVGCDHTTKKGMEMAKRIEQLFKTRCAEFKEEYKLNFGVYYTPAENLCYTAMKKFKDKYGEIKNVSDREFFTNSMHVPV